MCTGTVQIASLCCLIKTINIYYQKKLKLGQPEGGVFLQQASGAKLIKKTLLITAYILPIYTGYLDS